MGVTPDTSVFQLMVEAAPLAIIAVTDRGEIVVANRRAEAMFAYEAGALVGRSIESLMPQQVAGRHRAFVAAYTAAPEAREMGAGRELFARRADGTEFPVEIGLSPLSTVDGQLFLASIVDISLRSRAEAAHHRLAAIVESSTDAIVSKSLDGVLTSWNGGAERLFGYRPEEAVGQHVSLVIPPQFRDLETELLARVRNGERIASFETIRRRKDGSDFDVSVTLSPIMNDAGDVVGASSIARDITDIRRRDAELHRSNAELEQFAHVASHDLQEPLRMVANYTELLAERYRGQLDAKADVYIHYASDGARRMQQLVSDLLSYSRIGSQGKPMAPLSSREALVRVVQSLEPAIEEAHAVVEFDQLPVVRADDVQLRQLFQNLITNSIKFRSAQSPHIVVAAAREGAYWHFTVTDNGIGIEPQFAERVFQMFQRLHARDVYKGSGIGLSIAKRIVERHGGRVWIEPATPLGTVVHFTLVAADLQ